MRRCAVIFSLMLASLVCLAQMPPKEELTGTPKYIDDAAHNFKTFTDEELHAAVRVVAARSYAVFGYNTPEVRILLPQVSNSYYAEIDFPDPALTNAAGAKVAYELERGGFNETRYSDEIRFRRKNSEALLQFAHAKGMVKLKYPLEIKTYVVTPQQPGPPELGVKLDGPYVRYVADALQMPEASAGGLKPLRAYDAEGHRLEQYSVTETSTDDDGEAAHTAFYGNVARLEIDSVVGWADYDIPYNLTPAPMLPAGHEGEDPESYK